MNGVKRLAALEEIRRLKARYCYYLDTKQWDRCCHVWMAHIWQRDFGDVLALRVGCSHVSGLFMRHVMTAGPDVVRLNRSLSHYRAVDAQDNDLKSARLKPQTSPARTCIRLFDYYSFPLSCA